MATATQSEADTVMARIQAAIAACGGNPEDKRLADVRKWYQIFRVRPEHGALVVLEAELDKAEAALRPTPAGG